MATRAAAEIALLSIHPKYAEAIMRGEKRVEFRKQAFARPVDHVLVYATAPVQKVVGAFRVGLCDVASPEELWDRYRDVGGIAVDDFFEYYGDRSTGVAIHVEGTPTRLDIPLVETGHRRPPQSFLYVSEAVGQAIGALPVDVALEERVPAHHRRPGLRSLVGRLISMVATPIVRGEEQQMR